MTDGQQHWCLSAAITLQRINKAVFVMECGDHFIICHTLVQMCVFVCACVCVSQTKPTMYQVPVLRLVVSECVASANSRSIFKQTFK